MGQGASDNSTYVDPGYAAYLAKQQAAGFLLGTPGKGAVASPTSFGSGYVPNVTPIAQVIGKNPYASGQGAQSDTANTGGTKVSMADANALSAATLQNATPYSAYDNFMSRALPVATAGLLSAGIAGPAIAAGADLAGSAGAIGGGALAGATGGTLQAGLTGQSLGKGALTGAISGGLGVVAQPAIGALSSAGLGNTASSALVKGAIGAGVGAGSAALNGGSAARGAEIGGISGAASGATQGATGSVGLGAAAGTGAAILASKVLPANPAPAATHGAPPAAPASTPLIFPAPSTGTTNIGQYSGYGYAPRTQLNPGIDPSTYGQGPEAQFFSQPQAASAPPSYVTAQPPTTQAQPTKQSPFSQ